MSKESYSRRVLLGMYDKLKAIDFDNFNDYLSYDEDFLFTMCLAYMTLSKEKIIHKDMNNNDRLGRITNKVPEEVIDELFNGEVVPKVIAADEYDNTWILDNIRDSIMHEKFDIDEKRRLVLINNDWYDRKLVAEVPFEWFIKYMEMDMLRNRQTDNFTIHRFFYNNYWNEDKTINTSYVTNNSIYYRVDIFGSNIPIKEVEEKIDKLMNRYSKEKINEKDMFRFEDERYLESRNYNQLYFASYELAKDKLKEELQKDYPDANIRIFIDNRRDRINKKAKKKLVDSYSDYDSFYQDLSSLVNRKSVSLLKSISDLYTFIKDNNMHDEDLNNYLVLSDLVKLVNGKDTSNGRDTEADLKNYVECKQKLFLIYLHIYGLVTIVLNNERLQHPAFYEEIDDKVAAYSNKAYDEYATERRNIVKNLLEKDIKVLEMKNNYNNCGEEAKEKVKSLYDDSVEKLDKAINDYYIIKDKYRPEIKKHYALDKNNMDRDELIDKINKAEMVFESSNDINRKKQFKKYILDLYDQLTELEKKFIYTRTTPEDALEIMRNCFAHIGRVNVSNYMPITNNIIRFNDFDNNGELTGRVECRFFDLMRLLDDTYDYTSEDEVVYIRKRK